MKLGFGNFVKEKESFRNFSSDTKLMWDGGKIRVYGETFFGIGEEKEKKENI